MPREEINSNTRLAAVPIRSMQPDILRAAEVVQYVTCHVFLAVQSCTRNYYYRADFGGRTLTVTNLFGGDKARKRYDSTGYP